MSLLNVCPVDVFRNRECLKIVHSQWGILYGLINESIQLLWKGHSSVQAGVIYKTV